MSSGVSGTRGKTGGAIYKELPQGQVDLTEYSIKEFEQWRNGLTDDQIKAVERYGYDSSRINDYLRGVEVKDSDAALAQSLMSELDSAINNHGLSEDVVLYRGVGKDYLGLDLSSETSIKKLVGTTVTDPAYLSTTASQEVGDVYQRGAIFKINAPKGKKCAWTDIAKSTADELREYAAEGDAGNHEYLFGRNTKLKITGYKPRTINGKKVWEIQADLR